MSTTGGVYRGDNNHTRAQPQRRHMRCLLLILFLGMFCLGLVFSWWMGWVGYLPGYIALTKSDNAQARFSGCKALGRYVREPERTRAATVLIGCLSDTDSWVKIAALESLEELQYYPATSRIAALSMESDGGVAAVAMNLLAKWRTPEGFRLALLALKERHDTRQLRSTAAKCLGWYDNEQSLEAVRHLLTTAEAESVQVAAVEALGQMNITGANELLRKTALRRDRAGSRARALLGRQR